MASPSFEPSVVWEDRQWFWWERTLYGLITGEGVGRARRIGTCLVIGSLLLTVGLFVVLPLLPIILWLTSRDPLPPTGPLKVGVIDIQHSFSLTLPEPEPAELVKTPDSSPSKNTAKTTAKKNQVEHVAYRMRVFYPASPSTPSSTTRTPWLPRDKEYGRAHLTFMGLPRAFGWFCGWFLQCINMPRALLHGAKPHTGLGQLPLVIFSHGLGGTIGTYSTLCSEVASIGAVVVSIEHKDGTAVFTTTSDGHSVPYAAPASVGKDSHDYRWRHLQVTRRVAELSALLDGFQGALVGTSLGGGAVQIDTKRVSLIGHSFGGATVLEMAGHCAMKDRVKAVAALDPWMMPMSPEAYEGLAAPTLMLLTQSMMYPKNAQDIRRCLRGVANKGSAALFLEAKSSRHQDQSDIPHVLYLPCLLFCMLGGFSPQRALQTHSQALIGFFLASGAIKNTAEDVGLHASAAKCRALKMLKGEPIECDAEGDLIVHGGFAPSKWMC